jgi:hypothetical protein
MAQQGLLPQNGTSGEAIRAWLAAHRGPEAQAVMALNPRYIFFKLDPDDGGDPAGAAGIPLPARRAIAVDPATGATAIWSGSAPTAAICPARGAAIRAWWSRWTPARPFAARCAPTSIWAAATRRGRKRARSGIRSGCGGWFQRPDPCPDGRRWRGGAPSDEGRLCQSALAAAQDRDAAHRRMQKPDPHPFALPIASLSEAQALSHRERVEVSPPFQSAQQSAKQLPRDRAPRCAQH